MILVGFVFFYGLKGLKNQHWLFCPPMIISFLIANSLVADYYQYEPDSRMLFLDDNFYIMTLAYTALCLTLMHIGFSKGYYSSKIGTLDARNHTADISNSTVIWYVTVVAAFGYAGHFYLTSQSGGLANYYSHAHGSAGAYTAVSAYVYSLSSFLWPALLIGYVAWKKNERKKSTYLLFLVVLIGLSLLAHTLLFGNRNGIIRFVLILGIIFTFVERKKISVSPSIVILVIMSYFIVKFMPYFRENLHIGAEVGIWRALQNLLDGKAELLTQGAILEQKLAGGHYFVGDELFVNVAIVQSAWESGTYDYGARYIFPILNMVPRFLWPEKPYLATFGVDHSELIFSVTGWYPGAGAAYSAVGHSFLSFSWFGCIAWLAVGFLSGRLFRNALVSPTLTRIGFLAAILIGSVYWATQAFVAFYFHTLVMALPFIGLNIVEKMKKPKVYCRR